MRLRAIREFAMCRRVLVHVAGANAPPLAFVLAAGLQPWSGNGDLLFFGPVPRAPSAALHHLPGNRPARCRRGNTCYRRRQPARRAPKGSPPAGTVVRVRTAKLLELDRRAGFFQLLLDLLGLVLADAFLDRLRRTFDEIL